jgi:hypothetical protein
MPVGRRRRRRGLKTLPGTFFLFLFISFTVLTILIVFSLLPYVVNDEWPPKRDRHVTRQPPGHLYLHHPQCPKNDKQPLGKSGPPRQNDHHHSLTGYKEDGEEKTTTGTRDAYASASRVPGTFFSLMFFFTNNYNSFFTTLRQQRRMATKTGPPRHNYNHT